MNNKSSVLISDSQKESNGLARISSNEDTNKSPESVLSGLVDNSLLSELEAFTPLEPTSAEHSPHLQLVLNTSTKLKAAKKKDIRFSAPILTQNDNAVLFPRTINVIQGQTGAHKSRIAENLCSAMMKRMNCHSELLGFRRTNIDSSYTAVYVDTERNLSEQLPYALQSIQLNAGFEKEEDPYNFEFISLLQVPRKDRFTILNEYLTYIRVATQRPLLIVLDVSTDCIEDFNRVDKSMELIDLMNMAINEFDVTFLCIIHENPNSDKARGHFGTEILNKSSTAMQVRFEKDANANDTDILRVKYIKCRSTARHDPFFVKYSTEAKGLILASPDDVKNVVSSRRSKAPIEDIIDHLETYLGGGEKELRTDLLKLLAKDFDTTERTIEKRLKEIMNDEIEIHDKVGQICKLEKTQKDKAILYCLEKCK
jgi:hypothetical protein